MSFCLGSSDPVLAFPRRRIRAIDAGQIVAERKNSYADLFVEDNLIVKRTDDDPTIDVP
jgi:hypothetical protein